MDHPQRRVIYSPFIEGIYYSFGVIMMARNTNRYLVVRQKYSYGFSQLLAGHYRRGQLPDIVKGCLPEELTSICPEQFFNTEALERYRSNIDLIKPEQAVGKAVWSFPKGRRQRPTEPELEVAQREFREETGIEYPHDATMVDIAVERINDFNKQYIIKYWLVTVPEELTLPSKIDCPEVAERLWMSYHDLTHLLSPGRLALLSRFFLPDQS